MRVWLKALCAGAMLAALGTASAVAQPRGGSSSEVSAYLDNGMTPHAELGYSRDRTTQDLMVPLQLEKPYIWTVYLRAGQNYRVYGACDNSCSDLDMEIYGADGAFVDRDAETNDTPYVQITPTQTGRAYVRIWVYACESESCYAGARLVSGGRPAERLAQPDASDDDEDSGDDSGLEGGGGDDDYVSAVRRALDESSVRHEQSGYQRFGEDVIEPIELSGPGHFMTLHLERNVSYVFQGACDQDCSDVDMEIRDASGEQLALDVEGDDTPAVAVRPSRTGDYGLRIWLAACSVEPCYVGVRSYRQNR